MSLDYYVFQKTRLDSSLCDLEEAARALGQAKQGKDKDKKRDVEIKIKQVAARLAQVEPHLSSLWYEALMNNLKDRIREAWQESLTVLSDPWEEGYVEFSRLPENFGFIPETTVLSYLPNFSFILEIPFKLAKPFHSKDERGFYLLDNPLRREKVFKTPMIAASSWKGALRAAMVKQLAEWWESLGEEEKKDRCNRKAFVARRFQLAKLFGTEKDMQMDDENIESYLGKIGGNFQKHWFRRFIQIFVAKNGFFAGSLHFFPTFFEEVKLEVINPHDREKGISKRGPLPLECVSEGAKGNLIILCVPPVLTITINDVRKGEIIAHDLKLLAEGIVGMLTVYGFGAKTSSGFGVAEERLAGKGKLVIKIPGFFKTSSVPTAQPQHQGLPRYLEAPNRLIKELRGPDESLIAEEDYRQHLESSGRKYNKENQQLYAKAKAWWEREGKKLLSETASQGGEPEHRLAGNGELPLDEPKEYIFDTLREFCLRTDEAADFLMEGGKS